MPVYELINPSDPYTFEAPNIEVAGVCAVFLSTGFGAINGVDGDDERERTPVLFGWEEWLKDRGIMDASGSMEAWLAQHVDEVADAYDSFLIGGMDRREDVLSMLAELPEEKREAWRAKRQDRNRSSLNQIGERAYQLAKQIRKRAKTKGKVK